MEKESICKGGAEKLNGYSPEQRLITGVLYQLIRDIQTSVRWENLEDYIDAWSYVFGDCDEEFSYVFLCDRIQCCPGIIYKKIRKRDPGPESWLVCTRTPEFIGSKAESNLRQIERFQYEVEEQLKRGVVFQEAVRMSVVGTYGRNILTSTYTTWREI